MKKKILFHVLPFAFGFLLASSIIGYLSSKEEENHPVKTYGCGLDATFEYDNDTCQVDTIDKIDSHGNLMRVTSE